MPNLTDGERCTRRSSRAYPQVNRRFGLLTEQEAHESRAARRPEGSRAARDSQPEQVPPRRPSACSTFGVTVCGFMRCPPPPIASQATACWTRRPYRWRRGGACSEKAQTRDAARTPRWRLEKPMGATPLRVRGAPNSRRHGVHAKRERATLPASPSGGIGWEAGGMARSWNCPDASGAQPRAAPRRSGGAARQPPRSSEERAAAS